MAAGASTWTTAVGAGAGILAAGTTAVGAGSGGGPVGRGPWPVVAAVLVGCWAVAVTVGAQAVGWLVEQVLLVGGLTQPAWVWPVTGLVNAVLVGVPAVLLGVLPRSVPVRAAGRVWLVGALALGAFGLLRTIPPAQNEGYLAALALTATLAALLVRRHAGRSRGPVPGALPPPGPPRCHRSRPVRCRSPRPALHRRPLRCRSPRPGLQPHPRPDRGRPGSGWRLPPGWHCCCPGSGWARSAVCSKPRWRWLPQRPSAGLSAACSTGASGPGTSTGPTAVPPARPDRCCSPAW